MRIFVTGGTGNIGQWVTQALLESGHELVLLTRTPDRIPAYQSMPHVTLVEGNILDYKVMEDALQGCDHVVHIALGWGNSPVSMLEHDTRSTLFLLEAAERAGVRSFLYTSSTAAFGSLRDGMDETALPMPDNLYGATKAASDLYVLGFNQYYSGQGVYGSSVSIRRNVIRPGYIYSHPAVPGGASQSDTHFIDIAKAVLRNEDLVFDELDGTQFLSGRQIAQLYVKMVESDLNKEIVMALGRKYVSWANIAVMAASAAGSSSRITVRKDPKRDRPAFYCVDKMERLFGLSFEGDEDLMGHVLWNLERAHSILSGERVHDTAHVW